MKNRDIMGATNPANAAPGTIRKDFAESIEANSVHGSDSPEAAAAEIALLLRRHRDRRLSRQDRGERAPLSPNPSHRFLWVRAGGRCGRASPVIRHAAPGRRGPGRAGRWPGPGSARWSPSRRASRRSAAAAPGPSARYSGSSARLVAHPRAIGRVDHDQPGRALRPDRVADRALAELDVAGDAGALGIGPAHLDRPGIAVAAVTARRRRAAALHPPHPLPGLGIEIGKLLEGEAAADGRG